ncbi:MAG: tRNA pseudouridine(55) synthase TruB [Schwartzia sp.]|nr:tRNA pseudouridine(55) synthase TruB [Schwartzia sp. (in: firmicutes)]
MKDGFINVLKPAGMTSHDVVSFIRKTFNTKKVGHLGTLDPAASGVLPIAVGRATRLVQYFDSVDKSYRAWLRFGEETDTGDDLGKVISSPCEWSMPSNERLTELMNNLSGNILQAPPKFSAIKINGHHAYDLARKNIEIDMPMREVTIYHIEILDVSNDSILIDVDCSKGTYIRSICRDIGAKLNIPSTMTFLLRTRVGAFCVEEAATLEEILEKREELILLPEDCLSHLSRYVIADERIKPFINGLPTHDEFIDTPLRNNIAVFSTNNHLIGIGHFDIDSKSIFPDKIYYQGD